MFVLLYDFFGKRRILLWLLFAGILALSGWSAARLRYTENVSSMLPSGGALRVMNDAVAKTAAGEQIIFLIRARNRAGSPEDLIAYAESLGTRLQQACGSGIDTIKYGAGAGSEEALLRIVHTRLPLLLEREDYAGFDSLLKPDAVHRSVADAKSILSSPASVVYKGQVAADPLGLSRPVWQRLTQLGDGGGFEAVDGYLFADSLRAICFFLRPSTEAGATGRSAPFFAAMTATVDSWRKANPAADVFYSGGPLVATENAGQARRDTILTLSVTSVLLLALTLYVFRRKRTALALFIPVIWGAGVGLTALNLLQGHVSLIAVGAGSLVLGIAMDFAIHFLVHLRGEGDVRKTIAGLTQPLTLGSATTIAAFLALRWVGTPILQDLGLFAAASLTGAALCTLVFLPHIPLAFAKNTTRRTVFDKLATAGGKRAKWAVLVILLLTPVMLLLARRVQFDDDLMHLNYLSPEVRAAQDEIGRVTPQTLSSGFLIAKGTTQDDALEKLTAASTKLQTLQRSGLVTSVSNPARWTPGSREEAARQERWNAYWTRGRVDAVARDLREAALAEGFRADAFDAFIAQLSTTPASLPSSERRLIGELFPAGFASGEKESFAIATFKIAAGERKRVFAALHSEGVTVVDRQEGVAQLAGVLRADFSRIALWTSLIVALALLVGYGRLELAVIAFLPMVVSWIWILGLMALLGLKFNIVNIIVSTLIFGLGDDYTIFTMDGLVGRYARGRGNLAVVRAGIYISLVTILIGLGVLALARHPAMQSISAISIIGMLCVVGVSQTLQPALFNFWIQRRAARKQLPFTAWSFLKSCFAFAYFTAGALLLTVVGTMLVRLPPRSLRERGSDLLHRCICGFVRSLAWVMANVRKRYINRELYRPEPGIIIANHSSFLDILFILTIHPKIVLLTNDWVWRSPVFGALVRMAEYYPASDGAEASLARLRRLMERGYSIAVFPEGTRSATGEIGRFHKGAFYLAQQLSVPVKPIVLHGMGYAIQKGDWLLKDAQCSLHFYPPILPADTRWGSSYQERAKAAARWFREELQKIRTRTETPAYFREQLIRSYLYKGPVLEWYCRIKTRLEGNYEWLHARLPATGKVYDLGCGYGFATQVLQWSAPGRAMRGIDYDAEKIGVARHAFLNVPSIAFQTADLASFEPELCAGIVLLDVLHYLLPGVQEALFTRCANALQPGGVLVVRDGVADLKFRHRGTRHSEWWSTRVVRFNKTQNSLHYIRASDMAALAERQGLQMDVIDNARMTSNVTFVFTKPA